ALMILGGQLPGKVGRRRFDKKYTPDWGVFFYAAEKRCKLNLQQKRTSLERRTPLAANHSSNRQP
ncbi:MAG TPA: hypothetical protein PKA19_06815, partial [Bacillota bacterium]|nr:hypothetical protein [Bacillota bacterium]